MKIFKGEIYRPASEILNNPFFQDESNHVLSIAKEAGQQLVHTSAIDPSLSENITRVEIDIDTFHEAANMTWVT